MIKLWWWVKWVIWLYAYDEDEYRRVELTDGKVFYVREILIDHCYIELDYFYEGHDGNLSAIRPHVPNSVYVHMSKQEL